MVQNSLLWGYLLSYISRASERTNECRLPRSKWANECTLKASSTEPGNRSWLNNWANGLAHGWSSCPIPGGFDPTCHNVLCSWVRIYSWNMSAKNDHDHGVSEWGNGRASGPVFGFRWLTVLIPRFITFCVLGFDFIVEICQLRFERTIFWTEFPILNYEYPG